MSHRHLCRLACSLAFGAPVWLALPVIAPEAQAQPVERRRIAILPTIIEGPHGRVSTPRLFEAALAPAEQRIALEAASYNELFVDGAEPIAFALRSCGSDKRCLISALRRARIDLLLNVIANFALEPPLLTTALVSAATGQVLETDVAEMSDPKDVEPTVHRRTEALLDTSGFVRAGRIELEVSPSTAEIQLERQPAPIAGAGPHTLDLAPGPTELTVRAPGHVTEVRRLDLHPGDNGTVRIELEPEIGSTSILASPWFWVAAGAVVATGAGAAAILATGGSDRACLCVRTEAGACGACP